MSESDSEMQRVLLELVGRDDYRPVKPSVLARELRIPEEGLRDFKKLIKRLIKQGRLTYGSRHLVYPAGAARPSDLIEGRFRRTSQGYGFVIPDAVEDTTEVADIYVAADKTADAADRDRVAVKIFKRRGRFGRRSGRVIEVVSRFATRFVGSVVFRGDGPRVVIDGGRFSDPILVGDAGAKDCRDGDKVVVEMLRYPTYLRPGEGVVTEVLGAHQQPGVDTRIVMREYNLPETFPEEVLEESRQEASRFDEDSVGDRVDYSDLTVITIDPIDARDFDDAISLERIDNGHWRLGVHIADVSHFVRPNTSLDNEAYKRATSVYLPDRVVPMLPELISNGLASLQPDKPRYVRTAMIEFTPKGQRVLCEVSRGVIRSRRRFAYEEVDDYLEEPARWKSKLTPEVFELLRDMHALAMILRGRRLRGGAIELGLPEVKIDIGDEGRVSGAHLVEHTESHQVIEEFMLAANVAVSEMLVDRNLFFLRRIHPQPSPRKLQSLTEFVRGLGIDCENLVSRFEIKRVLEQVEGDPVAPAVHLATLRSMQKAVYSPREDGHYALNESSYCHFTSPIRRYPDLIIHRMLDGLSNGDNRGPEFGHLARLGEHCSLQEQNAERAERELIKLKLIAYLAERIGEELDVIVTGVDRYGLFAQGVDLPADGRMELDSLPPDHYDFEESIQALVGRRTGRVVRLGDRLRVKVVRADADRREIDYEFVAFLGSRGSVGEKSPKPGGMSRRGKRDASKSEGRPRRGDARRPSTGASARGGPSSAGRSKPPRKKKGRGRRRG